MLDRDAYWKTSDFLDKHPVLLECMEKHPLSGTLYGPNTRFDGKFSPKAARDLIETIISTDAEQLDVYGVKNWLDFYCYISRCLAFHENLIYPGFFSEAESYERCKQADEDLQRKEERRRKRKAKT